jgi:hypothetical protein
LLLLLLLARFLLTAAALLVLLIALIGHFWLLGLSRQRVGVATRSCPHTQRFHDNSPLPAALVWRGIWVSR